MIDLESIYRRTLKRCGADTLVSAAVRRLEQTGVSVPQTVVAIGKCAGPLLDGVAAAIDIEKAFAVIPHSYPEPRWRGNVVVAHGGHPDMDRYSFHAGDALVRFVAESEDVLFLISGGGSACLESPLPPFTREELIDVNRKLVGSSLPIGAINTVRKHLSAIKGGRLGARVRGRSMTLVYSDVSTGAIADVASGPTIADATTTEDARRILQSIGLEAIAGKLHEETVKHIDNATAEVIADNTTLVGAAAAIVSNDGYEPVVWPAQIETSVEEAAQTLAGRAASLRDREVLVAGGETTVVRRGGGKGGRCCELAVRFAMRVRNAALFGSSDGVDGTSGVAGVVLSGAPPPPAAQKLLETSDSLAASALIGRTIIIPPTGNNLRDLFLVAADNGAMAHH